MTAPAQPTMYTVDEGVLSVGGVGNVKDFTAQVESCKVTFGKESSDPRRTLSGARLGGAVQYPATLEVKFIQDNMAIGGLIDWTWANRGTEQPFTFSPARATDRIITGVVTIDPVDVGGDVGDEGPTSDVKWTCVGDPVLGADLA